MKINQTRILNKIFIIFVLSSLFLAAFAVDFVEARSSNDGYTKKSSTYEKRSELKESTKERVERSGSCALYCEIDHKIPLKCGGSNDPSNLQSLPENVHLEKTNREAKLCTSEHPELACGGLKQVTIDGFLVYICANAGLTGSSSYSYSSTARKSYATESPSKSSTGAHTGRTCYVNGYTTKKGTYVHGYYRRC
jgi:hypothetical protein